MTEDKDTERRRVHASRSIPVLEAAEEVLRRRKREELYKRLIGTPDLAPQYILPGSTPVTLDPCQFSGTLQHNIDSTLRGAPETAFHQCFPHFSWWLSFVHCAVFVAAISLHGALPFGMGEKSLIYGRAHMLSHTSDYVCRSEVKSIGFSLREADLVRIGARYHVCTQVNSPMRRTVRERQRVLDRESGCCVHRDGSGCYQSQRDKCSRTLATWLHYKSTGGSRIDTLNQTNYSTSAPSAGPVCGLDPNFCQDSTSSKTHEDRDEQISPKWSNTDVTEWPLCATVRLNQSVVGAETRHMECEVIGFPCCLGIRGQCIITTEDHCNFLRGNFNPQASLCSQVDCLQQACGYQYHRLVISLFIHSSFLHLMSSLPIQLLALQHFEACVGSKRFGFLFIGSGIFGNLVSEILQPNQLIKADSVPADPVLMLQNRHQKCASCEL